MASPITDRSDRSNPPDFLAGLGLLALGSRLRRISDRVMSSGIEIYRDHHLEFEPRWFPVFRYLADHGDAAVGEVARAIGFTHASVSQTATAMAKRGVIEIYKGEDDERRRVLRITPEGRKMLPELRELWEDIEGAARDIAAHSGVCVLTALDGMESAMDVQSLHERTTQRQQERARNAVEIVDFEPHLAPHFKTLNLEWLERYFKVEACDATLLNDPQREIIDKGGHILFAKIEDEIVGCAGLIPDHPGELELIKMAVTERHRGKQIGRRLIDAAIARARQVDAKSVVLETNSGLLPATSLYRSAGFRVTGSGPSITYERGDLFMRLDL